jgi:hypothetical protein
MRLRGTAGRVRVSAQVARRTICLAELIYAIFDLPSAEPHDNGRLAPDG